MQTSSTSAGDLKIISKGSLILDTSSSLGGTAPIIMNGGNVGIGVTNPLQRLQVNDTATAAFVVTSAGQVGIGTTGPGALLSVGANVFQVNSGGQIGQGGAVQPQIGLQQIRRDHGFEAVVRLVRMWHRRLLLLQIAIVCMV